MNRSWLPALARVAGWGVGIVVATVALTWGAQSLIRPGKVCPDFICYWAAATNVASGRSPYDVAAQIEVQQSLGWDKAKDGLGLYEFLPFYYPPWFAWLCMCLLPMGFEGAKVAWLVINIELVFASAYLLRNMVPGVPPNVAFLVVPLFVFTLSAVVVGQTSPLMLLIVVATLRLADARYDWLAGMLLGWATIKPQLTIVAVAGLLLWGARQRRWGLVGGFAAMVAVLCLASFATLPSWLPEMLAAPRRTPPPTEYFPWIGTTWNLILKGVGLHAWARGLLYLLVGILFLQAVVRAALSRETCMREVASLGLLAAYFVAPYGRHYDFPVLLVPFLVLLGTRLSDRAGTILLLLLMLAPYIQYMMLAHVKRWLQLPGRLNPEFTFFWIPALLAAVWFCSRSKDPSTGKTSA